MTDRTRPLSPDEPDDDPDDDGGRADDRDRQHDDDRDDRSDADTSRRTERLNEPAVSPEARTRQVGGAPTEDRTGSDSESGGWRRFGGRNMPLAIASGVILAVLLIGTVLWHPAAFTVLVIVIVLVGVAETGKVLLDHDIHVAVPVALVAALVMMVGTYRAGPAGQVVGVGVLLVGAIVWEMVDTQRVDVAHRIASTAMLGLWIPFLASYAVLLVVLPEGWVAVLAVAGIAVVADIGAFAVGIRFGQRKLAPRLSPAKTIEGVIGGLLIAMIVAAIILPLLGSGEMFSPGSAMVFALTVGIAGAVGDLAESMLKRDIGVKDFGGILPGHGGILDRVDSVLFALPTGYYVLALLN